MKCRLTAAAMTLLAAPSLAAPMEEACLSRGTWDAPTCTCIQGVADTMLDPETQKTAAAFFARQTTSQQIAAEKGTAAAATFLQTLAEFMEKSTAECGAP